MLSCCLDSASLVGGYALVDPGIAAHQAQDLEAGATNHLEILALDNKVTILEPLHHGLRSTRDFTVKQNIIFLIRHKAHWLLLETRSHHHRELHPGIQAVLRVLCPALVAPLVTKLHPPDGEAALPCLAVPCIQVRHL